MSTASEIITAAYQEIGIVVSGGDPSSSDLTWGLAKLNRLLKSLSVKGFEVPFDTEEHFTLTPGTNVYTIGSGEDFDTVRPTKIISGFIRVDNYDYPVFVQIPKLYWQIRNKTQQGRPYLLFYSPDSTTSGTIHLYYVPKLAYELHIVSEKPFDDYASASLETTIHPEYEDYIVTKLAISFCPRFGKQVPAELVMRQRELDSDLLGLNLSTNAKGRQLDLPGQRLGRYDVNSDTYL